MDRRPTSPSSIETHFVDIHEVLPKEKEGAMEDKVGKPPKRPNKFRDMKKPSGRSFSRQVSLETGFSVLNRESKAKDERRVLRSGKSFGGFGANNINQVGRDGRKGDFSIFMTKSSLTRQNSLLPSRKEIGLDSQKNDGPGHDDDSVPAGRYFAALKGPELDEVKVIYRSMHTCMILHFSPDCLPYRHCLLEG